MYDCHIPRIAAMIEAKDRVKKQFRVNGNAVTCIITARLDVEYRLYKYGLMNEREFANLYYDDNMNVVKYVGVAKCAPEDYFDLDTGKRIAEYRASEKRMRDVNRRLSAAIEEIENKINNLEEHGYINIAKKPEIINGTN